MKHRRKEQRGANGMKLRKRFFDGRSWGVGRKEGETLIIKVHYNHVQNVQRVNESNNNKTNTKSDLKARNFF